MKCPYLMVAAVLGLGLPGDARDEGAKKRSMLPETPDGWRYERIDFPLDFAPDLKFEGFEELGFAPGMFDPSSETYFTYIFALKLANVEDVTAPFLKSFLLKYYLGLCKAVAKSREIVLDIDKVSVTVKLQEDERLGRGVFHATIEMFDAFVTGKPLTLHVEVVADQRVASKSICLFALASPKPKKDPVWQLLYGLRKGFTCEQASSPAKP